MKRNKNKIKSLIVIVSNLLSFAIYAQDSNTLVESQGHYFKLSSDFDFVNDFESQRSGLAFTVGQWGKTGDFLSKSSDPDLLSFFYQGGFGLGVDTNTVNKKADPNVAPAVNVEFLSRLSFLLSDPNIEKCVPSGLLEFGFGLQGAFAQSDDFRAKINANIGIGAIGIACKINKDNMIIVTPQTAWNPIDSQRIGDEEYQRTPGLVGLRFTHLSRNIEGMLNIAYGTIHPKKNIPHNLNLEYIVTFAPSPQHKQDLFRADLNSQIRFDEEGKKILYGIKFEYVRTMENKSAKKRRESLNNISEQDVLND